MKHTDSQPFLKSVTTDMLNINLQIKDSYKSILRDNLKQLCLEYGINSFSKYGYANVVQLLKEEQGKTILYCIDHRYSDRAYIHLQLNPSELDKTLTKSLRGDLDYLLGDKYAEFFLHSNVTRLDIAADFLNLHIDDLLFLNPRQRRSGAFWDQHGNTSTIYLGHNKSKIQMRVYNKTAQSRKNSDGDCSQDPVTRIEATVNPQCPLRDIHRISNPFEGLQVYKLSHLIADDRLPFSFCDSIHQRGLTATLRMLKPDEKLAVKALLQEHVYQDFPAQKIFEQWKKSLRNLVPLKFIEQQIAA
jgi:hypothetical protein